MLGGIEVYVLVINEELIELGENNLILVPLHKSIRMFSPSLPQISGIEHKIDLIHGGNIPNNHTYRSNPHEAREYRMEELMEKGYVRESVSPCYVLIFLVSKKDGFLRMCINSRDLNNITIKYHFPILMLDDMVDELSDLKILSKVELRSGYYDIRIKDGDEWKTSIKREDWVVCYAFWLD